MPGSFVGCVDDGRAVEVCNADGTGSEQLSCELSRCSEELGRCDACDPDARPLCLEGKTRVWCSEHGVPAREACEVTCQNGRCCTDQDRDDDEQTDCAGDCNDFDNLVFRGQTDAYFQPTNVLGGFDYNCDGVDEPTLTDVWVCTADVYAWHWVETVPACGQPGRVAYGGIMRGERCTARGTKVYSQECK